MKLEKIDKKEEGKFITRYDITYKTVDDTTKIYEMISRNRNVQTREELRGNKPDAVVLMVTDESGEKIVLNKEFRMAAGTWVYNFPGGIDRSRRGAGAECEARVVGRNGVRTI